MNKTMAFSLALSLTLVSFAARADLGMVADPEIDVHAACPELALTQPQKDQIKAVIAEARASVTTEREQLKAAKEALMATLKDPNAEQAKAVEQQGAIKMHVDKVMDALFHATNQLVFTVLSKEQRPAGVACGQKIIKEIKKKQLQRRCAARNPDADLTDFEM